MRQGPFCTLSALCVSLSFCYLMCLSLISTKGTVLLMAPMNSPAQAEIVPTLNSVKVPNDVPTREIVLYLLFVVAGVVFVMSVFTAGMPGVGSVAALVTGFLLAYLIPSG